MSPTRAPGPRGSSRSAAAVAPDAPSAQDEATIARLQDLFESAPAPLEPLDLSALDGYLCGVLLQPARVPTAQWLAGVFDVEGRAAPAGAWRDEVTTLVQRRHAQLDRAIAGRAWFDPWLEALDDTQPPRDAVLPWVAGFALAMERFPALAERDDPALVEPLALLYLHFDAEDVDDERLAEAIEEIEPPASLAEAAEDVVTAVLRLADATRPRSPAPSRDRPRPRAARRS
jgi:uncharacterized protein